MLKDNVVVITGGSSGIGAAMASVFAKEYAVVVITYKENKVGAEDVVEAMKKEGAKALAIQADLVREEDARRVIEQVCAEFGRVDILINNAGRFIDGDEWNADSELWTRSLQQNLVSVMNVSKYAIEIFTKQKSGVIINIASRFAVGGQYDALAYSAAKAGIVNITQSYAKLLAPFGRANTISPGAVNTGYFFRAPKEEIQEVLEATPMRKLSEPEDVANLALFLVSDKAGMITGQNIFVDGGFTVQ